MDTRTALKTGIAQLREANVPSFTVAAELLLLHVLSRDRTWLYAHPETEISEDEARKYCILVGRRAAGEPTQYLTGKQEFWGLEFEVTPDVLIPRPETEHVIEVALDRLGLREIRRGRPQITKGEALQVADVGTGSGCIAVVLAKELPYSRIYATDVSAKALEVARRNASRHQVSERIEFVQCHLLEGDNSGSARFFDLIASNPPYIGRREAQALPREVREHEPDAALYGGREGHELYPELIAQAAKHLKPGGTLVVELGHDSLPTVQPLLAPAQWTSVGVTNDLAGIPRVVAAERI